MTTNRPGVLARVAAHRATAREAVGRFVCGDPVEDLVQDSPLDRLESLLRAFDHARGPPGAAERRVAVMPQPLILDRSFEPARVRQPRKLAVADAEERRELPDRRDLGHRPASPAHRGLWHQPPADLRRTRTSSPTSRLSLSVSSMKLASSRGRSAGGRWYAARTSCATACTQRGRRSSARPARSTSARSFHTPARNASAKQRAR